jgi:O-antigen ligase
MQTIEMRPKLEDALLLCLLAYPWLNPFAPNPSPTMVPWLAAWFCGIAAWWRVGMLAPEGLWRGASWIAAWLAVWVLVVVWRTPMLNSETLFTVCALGLLALAVDMGARAAGHVGILRTVMWAWLLASLLSSVIALLQYLELARYFYPLMNIATDGEAFANLRQRNQFATLANMGLAVLLLGGVQGSSKAALSRQSPPPALSIFQKWWPSLWPWLAMGLLVKANAASVSRTGMIGLLMVVAFAVMWRGRSDKRLRLLACAAPVVYVLAALCLPYVSQWFTGHMGNSLFVRLDLSGLQSCTSRKALYLNVLELIAQKPWLGWGWRELSFAHYEAQYDSTRFCEILDNAHNLPLQLAVELGVPAATLLVLGFLVPVVKAQPWRERVGVRQLAWAILALLMLHSLLEYPLWYAPFLMAFGLCLGLLWPDKSLAASASGAASEDTSFRSPASSASPWFLPRTLGAIAGIIAVLFASVAFMSMSQSFLPPDARSAALWSFNQRWPVAYWLFARQSQFAHLVTHSLEESDPAQRYALATALLHYSPEPRVVKAQLEAAEKLGLPLAQREAMARQFEAVYPAEYKEWVSP